MLEHSVLFAGSSHPELAEQVAVKLKIPLGKATIETFPDKEIGVRVLENVRGRDVFVMQSIAHTPNLYLMEMLIFLDALKRASARAIVAVIPYFGYARQDRKGEEGVAVSAKLVANLLERAGATQIVTLDLHAEQVEGFFDIPVENLKGWPLLMPSVMQLCLERPLVVVPDVGRLRLGRSVAEALGTELGLIDKRRIDGKQIESGQLVGVAKGRDVLLVDDICSTGATLKKAAQVCLEAGAHRVCAAVTHGPLLREALEESAIERMVTTNSVPFPWVRGEVEVVSIHQLLATAIEEIACGCRISSQ